jgi:hypothetical protein
MVAVSKSERSAEMKTFLGIMLVLAALIPSATVALTSSTAVAGDGGPDKWCGAPVCPSPRPPWIVRGR